MDFARVSGVEIVLSVDDLHPVGNRASLIIELNIAFEKLLDVEFGLLRSLLLGPEFGDGLARSLDFRLFLAACHVDRDPRIHFGMQDDAERVEPEWIANRRGADFGALLTEALGGRGVTATFASLEPRDEGYRLLRAALTRLRAVEASGGWPEVPGGETLRPGMEGGRVEALRRRLEAAGTPPSAPRWRRR